MSLSISLNKPKGSPYLPGETLVGSVTVSLAAPFPFFSITFEGRAFVHIEEWHQAHAKHEHDHLDIFEENETYISSMLRVLEKSIVPAGQTVFPFEYSLPTSILPCSVETPHGDVTYSIGAYLVSDKNADKTNREQKDLRIATTFIIGPLLDLNNAPRLQFFTQATQFIDEAVVSGSCCCREKELVKACINVPKRFFIPGECVRFGMQIQNESGKDLGRGIMYLELRIICNAEGRHRESKEVLTQVEGPEVKARSAQNWADATLRIPVTVPVGLPPTGLGGGCNIIDAEYALVYSVQLSPGLLGSRSMDLCVPLMVGTIPLNA